jgi:hypothetical protein
MATVSRTALWAAWKSIRLELRKASLRDVIDYLDYDIDPNVWINRLVRQVSTGLYEPATPLRFTLAKSSGFSRTMTFPQVPDLVLYRALTNFIHRKAERFQQPHVYFLRDQIARAQEAGVADAQALLRQAAADYRLRSMRTFLNWLRFDQYRKLLVLGRVHPYIVLTDITNFFDSILHSQIEVALRRVRIPIRMSGLLFFLLERLAIRHPYSESPRIGLPVDEFDCSRTLAHIVLFAHDDRMCNLVGPNAYVRWMDDQNFGVSSRSKGLRVLADVQRSLAQLHLTPNAKKSKVLSLADARLHFHFDANQRLDDLELLIKKRKTTKGRLRSELNRIYRRALRHAGEGEWEKVLSRIYRHAGLLKIKTLRPKAIRDALVHPALTDRICDYIRCSSSTHQYLVLVRSLLNHPEQVYLDVKLKAIEGLLRVEASGRDAREILNLAAEIVAGRNARWKGSCFGAPAALLTLRFGNGRSLPRLRSPISKAQLGPISDQDARASAIVYCSFGLQRFRFVRSAASRQMLNPLAAVVRLIEAIKRYKEVTGRYRNRLRLSYDSVSGKKYIDMRVLLMARLLLLNRHRAVRNWTREWAEDARSQAISEFDRKLIKRLLLS